jgi:hypothetical protein
MGQHRQRFELARGQYERALGRLHEVAELDENDIIRDSLVGRISQRRNPPDAMRRNALRYCALPMEGGFYWFRDEGEKVPEMVRPVVQAAFRCELISDPELWEQIKDYRNETSHTYNEEKAIAVAAFVRTHAVGAFDALRARLEAL